MDRLLIMKSLNYKAKNNIFENINSKINCYLPKRITKGIDFVALFFNIIINSKFNISEVIRKDYIT